MKKQYKGAITAIVLLLLLFAIGRGTSYAIFHTGVYGMWNDCLNALRYETNQEYNINGGLVVERCGAEPDMPAETLKNALDRLENFMFDAPLGMFIPFGYFQNSILFILICFFAGYYAGKKTYHNKLGSK